MNPVPPENVRLVPPDGDPIPLERRYIGLSADGVHRWVAISPSGVRMRPGMSISMDLLPAHTSVILEYEP